MMKACQIVEQIKQQGNPDYAARARRFFKTGKGEYGEGDKFIGVRVPVLRAAVSRSCELSLSELKKLLRSPWHEIRLLALFTLIKNYQKAEHPVRQQIVDLYLSQTDKINNWDLVDCSAHSIVGRHLENEKRDLLYVLVKSENLWERRIALISTFWFIKNNDFNDALNLCALVLDDKHDLIHKASGWVLREVGNKNADVEDVFLRQHYPSMPRTMLRYAIEKFPEKRRQQYLQGQV